MASANTLIPINERGLFSGLANMLRKESGMWWKTNKWWIQIVIWLVILNGVVAVPLWLVPLIEPASDLPASVGMETLIQFANTVVPLGVMILAQGLIVREKQIGTAAWVMAGPVSRASFVLAKLIGHAGGILIIALWLQALLAYLQSVLYAGEMLPMGPSLAALGMLSLSVLFYLSLALFLGCFFRSRGPVIGFSVAFFFVQDIVSQLVAGGKLDWLQLLLPRSLGQMAAFVLRGGALPSAVPLIAIPAISAAMIGIGIWRFSKEEF